MLADASKDDLIIYESELRSREFYVVNNRAHPSIILVAQ